MATTHTKEMASNSPGAKCLEIACRLYHILKDKAADIKGLYAESIKFATYPYEDKFEFFVRNEQMPFKIGIKSYPGEIIGDTLYPFHWSVGPLDYNVMWKSGIAYSEDQLFKVVGALLFTSPAFEEETRSRPYNPAEIPVKSIEAIFEEINAEMQFMLVKCANITHEIRQSTKRDVIELLRENRSTDRIDLCIYDDDSNYTSSIELLRKTNDVFEWRVKIPNMGALWKGHVMADSVPIMATCLAQRCLHHLEKWREYSFGPKTAPKPGSET